MQSALIGVQSQNGKIGYCDPRTNVVNEYCLTGKSRGDFLISNISDTIWDLYHATHFFFFNTNFFVVLLRFFNIIILFSLGSVRTFDAHIFNLKHNYL